jgi:hypothetical protein
MKWLTSLWIVVGEPAKAQLESHQKLVLLQFAKSEFDRIRKGLTDPVVWYDTLPPPMEFMRDNPAIFQGVYKDSLPVPPSCEIQDELIRTDLSFGCRGGGVKRSSGSSSTVGNQVASPDSSVMLMQGMMQMFGQLMNANMNMGAPTGAITLRTQPRRLTSVAFDEARHAVPLALCDRSPSSDSQLVWEDATPDQGERRQALPSAVQVAPAVAPAVPAPVAPAVAPVVPAPASAQGQQSISDILGALLDKNKDARAKAAAAKHKAKASLAAAAPAPKAAARAKKAVAKSNVAKHTAQATPPVASAEATGDAAAGSVSAPAAKRSAKAPAKPAADSDAG